VSLNRSAGVNKSVHPEKDAPQFIEGRTSRMLANGDTIEELLEEYPSLKREDILSCLDYAAVLAEEQVTPIEALEA
jgi:hypothetical protein